MHPHSSTEGETVDRSTLLEDIFATTVLNTSIFTWCWSRFSSFHHRQQAASCWRMYKRITSSTVFIFPLFFSIDGSRVLLTSADMCWPTRLALALFGAFLLSFSSPSVCSCCLLPPPVVLSFHLLFCLIPVSCLHLSRPVGCQHSPWKRCPERQQQMSNVLLQPLLCICECAQLPGSGCTSLDTWRAELVAVLIQLAEPTIWLAESSHFCVHSKRAAFSGPKACFISKSKSG